MLNLAQNLQGLPAPLDSPRIQGPIPRSRKANQSRRNHSRLNTRVIIFILLAITSAFLIIHESSALQLNQTPTTPASFGVAAGFGNLAGNTVARQSLLRLGNTTGLNFFIANGDLATGYYYGHEQDWCNDFHTHYQNLIILAGTHDTGHDFTGDYEIYDANNNGVYETGDTILLQGSGPLPVLGSTSLNSQTNVKYVDVPSIGHWIPGDPVIWDQQGAGIVQSQMPLLSGPMPTLGTKLSTDPKLKFYDSTGDGFNTFPSGNRNFEAFTASPNCNTPPPSITSYHYSGINCSPELPGQPGYSFPTCYGREFYFDCCKPIPQIRIIMISPGIQNITGLGQGFNVNTWNFQKGDSHYNWTRSVIQNATRAGLVTMVVSADVCPSLGTEECGEGFHTVTPIDSAHSQFGMNLVDLLAAGNVDLWVGGSDFGYARQKQMTSFNCPFTATSYNHDGSSFYANKDICKHIPDSFTGNVYNQGLGYAGIVSAAFGGILRYYNESGEPIVQDFNNNKIYDALEPVLAWPPPPVGSPLTGPISNSPNNLLFNDVFNTGLYNPVNDTLYFDANGNGQWDPGETILEGPFNVWQLAHHPVPASQFNIVDWNGNGQWDQTFNGSTTGPHHALLAQGPNGYYSTFMGKNTPCNTTTCRGHGWLQFTIGFAVTGSTHFCRDGEHPTSNFSDCLNPIVYSDSFTLNLQGAEGGARYVRLNPSNPG